MTNRTKPGRLLCLLLCVLLLWGCDPASANRYSLTYLELFDTVVTIVGYDSTSIRT